MSRDFFSPDSEVAFLSIILNNPETIFEVMDVKPFMLSSNQNVLILDTIFELVSLGNSVEYALLLSYLESSGNIQKAGGKEYLTYIRSFPATRENIKQYADVIVELFKTRELLSISAKLPTLIEKNNSIDTLLSTLRTQIDNLSFSGVTSKIKKLSEYLPFGWDSLVRKFTGEETAGISTGYSMIDKVTGGLGAGDIWFVASRPSHGKTSLLCNILLSLASRGIPVLLFSLEMGEQALLERFISIITGINLLALRIGNVNNGQVEKIKEALKILKEYPIYWDTSFTGDVSYVVSSMKKYYHQHGVRVFALDYIQLLAERGNDATHELGRISRLFKLTSRELQVSSIVVSQVNRNLESREDKRPTLADLRQSGNLEEDGDLVVALYRNELYYPNDMDSKNKIEFIIRKQRNGPIGVLLMDFNTETTKIAEYKHE